MDDESLVTVGVDTHTDVHVAAVIDQTGRQLGVQAFSVPPDGLRPRLDRVSLWVRLWYRTPFVDRYAHAWMWAHGGWNVLPPTLAGS